MTGFRYPHAPKLSQPSKTASEGNRQRGRFGVGEQLVKEGRLTPVTAVEEKITYHDPCFLGRHNKVYTPPREIIGPVPGTQAAEMHRCKERGFCCGAGGARMWMEERIGKRINTERIDEALDPDTVSRRLPVLPACPGGCPGGAASGQCAGQGLDMEGIAGRLGVTKQAVHQKYAGSGLSWPGR
jgi:hypothetical protein